MSTGNAKRLTVEAVSKLRVPETGRTEVYDAKATGLFLRITATGRKS